MFRYFINPSILFDVLLKVNAITLNAIKLFISQ